MRINAFKLGFIFQNGPFMATSSTDYSGAGEKSVTFGYDSWADICRQCRQNGAFSRFTICLENGADVKTVSAMLGHTSSSFTLDQYGHLTPQMQKAAADKMADFMDGAQRFVPVVSA